MYHYLVYCDRDPYSYPCAVHIFSHKNYPPQEVFAIAKKQLDKDFPDWRNHEEELRYVGVEEIPIVHHNEYIIACKFSLKGRDICGITITSSMPDYLQDDIKKYRFQFLTLDYDSSSPLSKMSILEALEEFPQAKLYKTRRGYHIRCHLNENLSFDELLELRRRFNDDPSRIEIDEAYHEQGYDFLTNTLFNKKWWISEGEIHFYQEEPIPPADISVEWEEYIKIELPQLTLTTPKGTIHINGKAIKFSGRFTRADIKRIIISIEDNLWEYGYYSYASRQKDIKTAIAKAYAGISPILEQVVSQSKISIKDGKVIIHVPQHLSQYVGRLIGKAGMNIKAVESKLGIKIAISQESTPEEILMKQKLQELLKKLV